MATQKYIHYNIHVLWYLTYNLSSHANCPLINKCPSKFSLHRILYSYFCNQYKYFNYQIFNINI